MRKDELMKDLLSCGFKFNERGDIVNFESRKTDLEGMLYSWKGTIFENSVKDSVSNVLKNVDEYNELNKVVKTNKINYKDGLGILSWELLDKNNLKVKVHSGRFHIVTLLKILISEIDVLKEFSYKRISPYKLEWERPMHREDKTHVYKMVFIDVKDENKIKESEIIKLNCSMSLEVGEYNFFIPDLLELARLKGLVKLEEDIYKYVEGRFIDVLNIKYIDDSMSKEKLKASGWTVPIGYVER